MKAVVCCLYRYRTISVKVDAVISWSVKLYRSWIGLPVALLYGWTANVVYAILWCLGPLATRLVQPTGFPIGVLGGNTVLLCFGLGPDSGAAGLFIGSLWFLVLGTMAC